MRLKFLAPGFLLFLACGPKIGDDTSGTTAAESTGTSDGSTSSATTAVDTGGPGTGPLTTAADTSSASETSDDTTGDPSASDTQAATSDTTDPSAGETGTPVCEFDAPQGQCEDPYCVAMSGRQIQETAQGFCWSKRPTYLGCVDCYGFESEATLCKDKTMYIVPGLCEPELWKFMEAGYQPCDPPPGPIAECP